ncbi:MAG: sugar-binding domain-containing protein [Aerococcus sp.]|nr:sugar-binding domain-containing protein [Aerococcus sp.]
MEVVPELDNFYWRRIQILREVLRHGPIGRKMLAEALGMTERPLRHEIDILKGQGLITVNTSGMSISEQGQVALAVALKLSRDSKSNRQRERQLQQLLMAKDVYIASGDSNADSETLVEMGVLLTNYLENHLSSDVQIIAITGGTTMKNIVPHIQGHELQDHHSFTVVSARGGMEEAAEVQANTIAEQLAVQLGGRAYMLYSPETMTVATFESLVGEPIIQRTLRVLAKANVVLFSVGDAKKMALRRRLDEEVKVLLREKKAVGEIFGCFFDREGQIVYRIPRIGLKLEQLKDIQLPILIAGGSEKAEAVQAFSKMAPKQTVIITDEGCSLKVLNGETQIK